MDKLDRRAGMVAKDLFTDGQGKHYDQLAMSDGGQLGWGEPIVRDKIAQALRDVQRETAEECCLLICSLCAHPEWGYKKAELAEEIPGNPASLKWMHSNKAGSPWRCEANVIRERLCLKD